MLSAICFNWDESKILSSGNGLTKTALRIKSEDLKFKWTEDFKFTFTQRVL